MEWVAVRTAQWCALHACLAASYHAGAAAGSYLTRTRDPSSPSNRVPAEVVEGMISASHSAFGIYVFVPLLLDVLVANGLSRACESVAACGGGARAAAGCAAYLLLVEGLVFAIHYALLHASEAGRRWCGHAAHHSYRRADRLNAYAGFAFAPQDGLLQGLPLVLATLVVPVPLAFVYAIEAVTAAWALYIHTSLAPLPWPLMGSDYHLIHHTHNWYNFGFLTVLFDTLAGTVKHPRPEVRVRGAAEGDEGKG